ncbi:AfsR/SARP family transcriptional regulator [Streptomyces klenkii]|uniref:AfsR/SARP family transcriptional regulator n=1 Tax=Streptomyces klenkii TaxID=1420899 RepID=UPI00341D9019
MGNDTVIESAGQRLLLSSTLRVDLHHAWAEARQIIDESMSLPGAWEGVVGNLSRELLPGWTEGWLLLERDRWDQMRVYALESLAQQLQQQQHYLPALQSALAAVAVDPFRETAYRIVIEVHLAEGNVASAVRRYRDYRAYLRRELNVTPSSRMTQLMRDLMPT